MLVLWTSEVVRDISCSRIRGYESPQGDRPRSSSIDECITFIIMILDMNRSFGYSISKGLITALITLGRP